MINQPLNILLVEDDKVDVMNVKRAFEKNHITNPLFVAGDGLEALEKLRNGEVPQGRRLVLLDLNMPKMNGIEFLTALRKKEEWKDLKVFIVTTSDERVDRDATRKLGISGYIVKPLKLNNPSSIDSFNLMIDLMNMKGGR